MSKQSLAKAAGVLIIVALTLFITGCATHWSGWAKQTTCFGIPVNTEYDIK
jgi:hypothetical protein